MRRRAAAILWGVHPTEALLLAALAQAPRRYRMPLLPANLAHAEAAGWETALAYAIEMLRTRPQAALDGALRSLFTRSLARLVREALDPVEGDAAFQALLLRTRSEELREYLRLSNTAASDRRAARATVNAIAHPARIAQAQAASQAPSELVPLQRLQALLGGEDWPGLAAAFPQHAGLQRLARMHVLSDAPAVQAHAALVAQLGPVAGSQAAAAQGRAAARVGDAAEHAAVQAFRRACALINEHAQGSAAWRVLRSLRTPQGFPGEAGKAKDEWDAAIARVPLPAGAGAALHIVLLVEVKATPTAAAPDFSRLRRGLHRLALAQADEHYSFATADGMVELHGESLRALEPRGRALPPQVIYCCAAPPEDEVQMLSPATKAQLLAEAESLAFAQALLEGHEARGRADVAYRSLQGRHLPDDPPDSALAPVWRALAAAPRLRAALHQHETACAAREAMLHPDDLVEALAHALAAVGGQLPP